MSTECGFGGGAGDSGSCSAGRRRGRTSVEKLRFRVEKRDLSNAGQVQFFVEEPDSTIRIRSVRPATEEEVMLWEAYQSAVQRLEGEKAQAYARGWQEGRESLQQVQAQEAKRE